ncbi:MAG: bacterial Ig-like domain-containing protein, partial [Bacilli bacterium]
NENNKIAKAKVLVKIAENSLNQKDVDVARKFVEGLKDSKAKTDLLARLDRVQEIIDEIARIDAATKAVEKAEFEKIQANVDVAQLLVNKVTDAKTKEALQNRLDRVQETINAVKELTELLKTKYDKEKYTTNSYNNYEQAVAKVLDENGNVIVSNLTAGEIIALTNDIRNAINNLELLKLLSISLSSTGKEYVRNEVQENIVVTAIYNDTLRNKVLAINPNEKFNSSVVTKTPLVLTYTFEGVTATYTYTVVRNSSDQELVSLYAGLDKKEYYRGETEYTLTVTSYDKDQTENVVTDYVLLNEFDTSTVGPHYLKVSYTKNGKTVTVNAHYVVKRSFEDQQLKSLDVFMPTYTFPFNSEIGVYSVFVTEGDGTRYEVTKDAVITNFYTTEEGKRIMTVSYTNASGKTIKKDIEYTVLPPKSLAKLIGLQVTLAKRTFGLNEELGTYKVIATYSDKTTKDVTSLVKVDGFDTTTLGKKVMKFVYYKSSSEKGEAYKNYEVIRSEEGQKLDRIEATFGDKSVFFKGESLSNLVVTAYDKDGTKHEVKDNFTTNFDSTTAGEKILTVTYNGITTTLKYTVLENPLDLIQNIDFSLNEGFYKGLGYSYYLVVKNMDSNVKINSITAYDNGINDIQNNVEFTIDENGYRLNSEDFHNIIYNNTTVSNHFVTIKYTVYGKTYTALYTEEFNKLYFYQYG